MNARKLILIPPLMLVIAMLPAAVAQIPTELAAPLEEHANLAKGELEQKALQHLQEGNLTQEHILQDLNSSKGELAQKAVEHVSQDLNLSQQQIEERAKAEIQNQVNQRVQQPGFEAAVAAGVLALAYLARRKQ